MDFKILLGDSYTEEIETAIKAEMGKEFIPKEQYNKKIEELKATTDKMDELQINIEKYSKSDETIEDLQKKLTETTTEFDNFKTDSQKRETNLVKLEALKKSFDGKINKDSIDLIVNTYNLDEIVVDSKGQIVDLDVKLEAIKTLRPSLIIDENLKNELPAKGGANEKVDWGKLSDQEYFDKKNKKE